MTACEYKPGLEGIPATQSAISHVDGQQGILEYRGIRVEELAQHSTFLETAYLLIWGGLPNQTELDHFEREIRNHRRLKYRIRDMMKCFPEGGHPMDALQACAAALGLFYSKRTNAILTCRPVKTALGAGLLAVRLKILLCGLMKK
jgi:citrate synthase